MLIHEQNAERLIAGHFELGDQIGDGLFFFDLLADEPLQKNLRRRIAFAAGQRVKRIDRGGDLLFVFEHLLERLQRFELLPVLKTPS